MSTAAILAAIGNGLVTYGPMVLSTMGAAAAASAWLPKGQPGTAWATIRTGIDWLGQNYRNAKNVP